MSTTLAHTAAITEACNALRSIAAELLELKQKVTAQIARLAESSPH